MSAIAFEKDSEQIVTLTIDMPGQSANTMSGAFKEAFQATLDRLEAERDEIAGVIIASAKKSFFAGGDLNDLIAVRADQAEEFFRRSLASKGNLRRLEKLGKPVVAAINGAALGGGWEICLASHARFCLDDDKIALGLPEVTLGLLPGAGGVTRMTRLLGLQAALPYLMDGKQFTPAAGVKAGLITGLAADRDDMLAQARAWIRANPAPRQPWDQDGYKVPGGLPGDAAQVAFIRGATGALLKKTRGCYPAPAAILAAAVEGLMVDIDTALRIEARYFTSLVIHPVSKNMIGTFFFQMNEIKAGKSRPAGFERTSFSRIGVLGAGMMGAGIAYANALRGLTTVLKDVSLEAAQKGKAYTEKLLSKRVEQGAMSAPQREAILALIVPTADTADLAGCDLIIEAVFEQRELKAQLTREAEPHLAPGGVMASNTSTLPITGLASASCKPENFIGLHFFSPVDKMPLVEIIKGKLTSAETVARAYDYVLQIGKTPIVVNDSRGFFTSRVFRTFRMEGLAMLAEGLDPAMIENAGVQVGMPVGPLAVADEVSMALGLSVIQQTRADFADEGKAWVPHPGDAVLEKMVLELKRPGRAGGGGFYQYPADGRKFLWPGLAEHYPRSDRQIPFIDMKERILFIQSVESVRCLEEGVLESVRDANIGSIFGIGAPKWSGGTLQYINQYGVRKFALRAAELAARYGKRFEPPALLLRHAEIDAPFV
jgi:3-hydroxyacyl-CoA dehydrogenase/enoyl-CoA hydratase/3-hydroxybutyryl-CoA epimerase